LHPSTSAVLVQFTHKDIGFDLKQLVPVSEVAYWPWAVIISTRVPANSIKEFVDLAKASPDEYKFNTSGIGTLGHLLTELFMIRTGIKMMHVPYASGTAAAVSMENGETDLNIGGADSVASTPGLKALCMAAPERQPRLPDLPTCVEAGVPGFTIGNWAGLFVPPGTPDAIVNKLSAAVQGALKDPDVIKKLAAIGDTAQGSSPADFRKMRDKEFDTWKEVVATIGFQPE
jgi:tripartite-type tricarboxylate transporter receptor subunit TctC